VFTKVLDEMPLGLVEEDEEVQAVTNRDYWLNRGSDTTVRMADEILELVNSIKPGFTLKYNKFYIGLAKNGQANNFAICRPKKNYMRLEVKLPKTPDTDKLIESSGIEEMGYDNRWGNYRLRFSKGDIKKQEKVLLELLRKAESNYNG
jgi:predicted transport protein